LILEGKRSKEFVLLLGESVINSYLRVSIIQPSLEIHHQWYVNTTLEGNAIQVTQRVESGEQLHHAGYVLGDLAVLNHTRREGRYGI
jgi:hypothetical protein